jgi:hypothetical protein
MQVGNAQKFKGLCQSYYRTHLYNTYGGDHWYSVLVALGELPESVIDITNHIISCRIEKAGRKPTEDRIDGARLSRRGMARQEGKPVPQVEGPTCRTSPAKQAREAAKALENKLRRFRVFLRVPRYPAACHPAATPLSCRSSVAAIPLPCRCHPVAIPLPSRCHPTTVPL